MKGEDIKIGDILRIRQWDDMLSEFSLTMRGSIKGKNNVFSENMRYLCGQTFTVSSITTSLTPDCLNYHSIEGLEYTRDDECGHEWFICDWMLEPYTVINCSSADEVSALLFD